MSCQECVAGKYGPGTGWGCLECASGTHSLALAAQCTSCEAGKSSSPGSSSCEDCTAGEYGSGGPCATCPQGKYSPPASTSCTTCQVGRYAGAGQGACTKCGQGKYLDFTGAVSETQCKVCAKGKYNDIPGLGTDCPDCQKGKFAAATGYNQCEDCTTGTYTSELGSERCTQCKKGKHADEKGLENCLECALGSISDYEGAVVCAACVAGKYGNVEATACNTCITGTYSDGGAGSSDQCNPCEDGFYSNNPSGAGFCLACDAGKHSSEDKTECLFCPAGKMSGVAAGECVDCDVGKFAEGEGNDSCLFCDDDEFIRGSTTNTTGTATSSGCICNAGQYEDHNTKRCESVVEGVHEDTQGMSVSNLKLKKGAAGALRASENAENQGGRARGLSESALARKEAIMAVVAKIQPYSKIFLSYFQVAGGLSFAFSLRMPPMFSNFMNTIRGAVSLDIVSFMPIGCITSSSNYHYKMLSSTFVPFAIGCLMIFAYKTLSQSNTSAASKELANKIFGVFLTLSFLILPSTSVMVFSNFACQDFDEGFGSYLKVDYSIDCNGTEHKVFSLYAMAMICVYPIGVPLMYYLLLRRERAMLDPGQRKSTFELGSEEKGLEKALKVRHELEEAHPEIKRLEFLYKNYEPQTYDFEVFETLRKLMLTGGLVFLKPGTGAQIVIAMLMCMAAMKVYAAKRPFIDPDIDTLSEAAQYQLYFVMFSALLMRVNLDGESLQDQKAMDYMMLAIQGLAPATMILSKLVGICQGNVKEKFKEAARASAEEYGGGGANNLLKLGDSVKDLKGEFGGDDDEELGKGGEGGGAYEMSYIGEGKKKGAKTTTTPTMTGVGMEAANPLTAKKGFQLNRPQGTSSRVSQGGQGGGAQVLEAKGGLLAIRKSSKGASAQL
ncbi:hypothetical protein TL16_g11577 [Triparma laevis f. inornata]|uniref:Uncharacterized protein n=1 Tax=Triparma laevis f. inornata TaxID=1714386 RepID=A0A9W7BG07_9STRA|nr:hypothetical protein TL16_g11577 [Triparma laevis f. inornata]